MLFISCGKKEKGEVKSEVENTSVTETSHNKNSQKKKNLVTRSGKYTSLSLNGLIDVLFFEEEGWFGEDVIVLSQDMSDGGQLLWLVENNAGFNDDFSEYAHRLVNTLRNYSYEVNDDFMHRLVCIGTNATLISARRQWFFRGAIYTGTFIKIDMDGNIIRYGTEVENRIQDDSELQGYYISSVKLHKNALTSIVMTSGSESKTLNRVDVPEELTLSELEVDASQINLQTFNQSLDSLWDDGNFSSCVSNTLTPR